MRRSVVTMIGACVLTLLGLAAARPGEEASPDLSALLGIQIDAQAHRLTIDGTICLDQGILEYLAVVTGGKEYESVLALNCKAAGLHAALLLIGGEPGDLDPRYREDAPTLPESLKLTGRQGARFNITVRWKDGDAVREVPATQLLLSRQSDAPPPAMPWVFTGSYFIKDLETGKELYMARLDGTLAAVYYDPAAILNLPAAEGNPYRGEKTGFTLNTHVAPPRGTRIQAIFELAPPAE